MNYQEMLESLTRKLTLLVSERTAAVRNVEECPPYAPSLDSARERLTAIDSQIALVASALGAVARAATSGALGAVARAATPGNKR